MKIAIKFDNHSYSIAQLKEIISQEDLNLTDKPELKQWLVSQRLANSKLVTYFIVKIIPEQRPIVYMKLDNFESTAKSLLNI